MKTKILIFVVLSMLLSCKKQLDFESEIKSCVNSKMNVVLHELYFDKEDVDVYDLVDEIEEIIFKNKSQHKNYKKAYFELLNNLDSLKKPKTRKSLERLLVTDSKYAFMFDGASIHMILLKCPIDIFGKEEILKNKKLNLWFEKIDEYSMYSNEKGNEILKDWILKISEDDFRKEFYRIHISILIAFEILYDEI